MGDVVEINNDTLFYIKSDGKKINGVGDSVGLVEFINIDSDWLGVYVEGDCTIEKHKFKQLCIAWLLLNYPDVINTDIEPPAKAT